MSEQDDFTYIEGKPYRGKSQLMSLSGVLDMSDYRRLGLDAPTAEEAKPMQRVRLVVPFHTVNNGGDIIADALDNDSNIDNDETLEQVNVEVRARYAVQDVAEAQKLLAAAEVLGFRCTFDSGDPNDDDHLAIVTVTMAGIAE